MVVLTVVMSAMGFNSKFAAPAEESAPSLPTALFRPLLVVESVTSLLFTFNGLIYFFQIQFTHL